MALDLLVNRALLGVRLIERALHDRGRWTAHWAGMDAPVERTINNDGVTLTAEFSDYCLIAHPPLEVEIRVDGDPVAVRTIPFPGDGGFTFKLRVRLDAERVAA